MTLMKRILFGGLTALSVLLIIGCKKDKPEKWEDYEGAGYVNLGLSVCWASCNLGTTNPQDPGNLFAWGETETKTFFNIGNGSYKYGKGVTDRFTEITKYVLEDALNPYGPADNKTVLEPSDDAATMALGSSWHIPTEDEWGELIATSANKKHYKWEYVTGGLKIKYLDTGATLFLPAAGYVMEGKDILRRDVEGLYWSSTLSEYGYEPSERALYFRFDTVEKKMYDLNTIGENSQGKSVYGQLRFRGLSIRPVRRPPVG